MDEVWLVADRREVGPDGVGRGCPDFPGPLGARGPDLGDGSSLAGSGWRLRAGTGDVGDPVKPTSLDSSSRTQGRRGQVPAAIYDFSIHPARMIEGLWPNVFGTIARGNHRWLEALPPTFDYQVWLESLYQGGPILILGLVAAGFRRGASWRAWLTGAALVGLAAGLGTYGSPLFSGREALRRWHQSSASIPRVPEGQGDSQGAAWRLWRHLLVDGHRPAWFQLVSIPGEAPRHRQPGNLRACRTGVGRGMPDRLATAGPASHRRAGYHRLLPGLALGPDGAREIHPLLDAPSGPDNDGLRTPGNHRRTRGCVALAGPCRRHDVHRRVPPAVSLGQAIATTGRRRGHRSHFSILA